MRSRSDARAVSSLSAVRLAGLDRDRRRLVDCATRREVLGRHSHHRGRRLDGRRHGRDDRIGIVDVQVGLDRRAELVARTTELAQRTTDHPSELGKLARTEYQQSKHPDDEHLLQIRCRTSRFRVTRAAELADPGQPRQLGERADDQSASRRGRAPIRGRRAPYACRSLGRRGYRRERCHRPSRAAAGGSAIRSRAMRKRGGSGLPTTIGWTPAAKATAATMAPAARQEIAALDRHARVDVRRDERGAARGGPRGSGDALVAQIEVVADGHDGRRAVVLDVDQLVAGPR